MTITRERIMEVVRYLDAQAEEWGDNDPVVRQFGVEPLDVAYVAMQRAVRLVMARDGMTSRTLSRTEKTVIQLNESQRELATLLAVMWNDGFACRVGVKS